MTLKEIASEMTKVRNLTTIIEKKEDELESLIAGLPARIGETPSSVLKSFLEKAIRESVEEALREVRPEDSSECSALYMDRIKEFMK